ncbi:hypothetical protein O7630_11630 [Micromonospora sp. WMMD718]|uniref:hypothetical protein n=1 Tax=unclassified Micromonospora TaxID=2617518 RepID=UPI00064C3F1B|nr:MULTISPECIES: hypothetical protein [unclassified Micromonospora]MDG4751593.1 hypothetical protein [Micromonospora sp. WMMD718]
MPSSRPDKQWEILLSYQVLQAEVITLPLDDVNRRLAFGHADVLDAHAHLEDGGAYRAAGATLLLAAATPWDAVRTAMALTTAAYGEAGVGLEDLRELTVRPAHRDPRGP